MEQVITRKTASIFNTCAMLKCTISLKGATSLSLNLILINVNIDNCRVLLVFLREILPWLPHYSLALLANHHLVASTNVTSPTVRACSLSPVTQPQTFAWSGKHPCYNSHGCNSYKFLETKSSFNIPTSVMPVSEQTTEDIEVNFCIICRRRRSE